MLEHLINHHGLTNSAVDHSSQPPEFKFWHGHLWRVFHLSLRLVTHFNTLCTKVAVKHRLYVKSSCNEILLLKLRLFYAGVFLKSINLNVCVPSVLLSAHLAYGVHQSGHKTSMIIIFCVVHSSLIDLQPRPGILFNYISDHTT